MNGKIKTKFAALFAVALMITVCVVPVVGNEGTDAAPVSSTNGEVFEGYDITLYKEGGDYSGLVYHGILPAGFSKNDWTVSGNIGTASEPNGYWYNDAGEYLLAEDIPGYVVTPDTYGMPMIQFVFGYEEVGVNPIDFSITVGNDTNENLITYSAPAYAPTSDKNQGIVTIALGTPASGYTPGVDMIGLSAYDQVGDFDVTVVATQGITQQVIEETVNAGAAVTVSGIVKDAGKLPIKGATVTLNDSRTVTTKADGKYSFNVQANTDVEASVSYTDGDYTFDSAKSTYSFGTVVASETHDFEAKEYTGKVTINDANGKVVSPNSTASPYGGISVGFAWYSQTSSTADNVTTYTIGTASTGKAEFVEIVDGVAYFSYIKPTAVSGTTFQLIATASGSGAYTFVDAPSIVIGQSQKSITSIVSGNNAAADVTNGNGSVKAKEKTGTITILDSGSYPSVGATATISWYSQVASTSGNTTIYTISDISTPTTILSSENGVVTYTYQTPAAATDTTFFLLAEASGGINTYDSIPATWTDKSLSSQISGLKIGDATQNGNATIKGKNATYMISGTFEGYKANAVNSAVASYDIGSGDVPVVLQKDGTYKFYVLLNDVVVISNIIGYLPASVNLGTVEGNITYNFVKPITSVPTEEVAYVVDIETGKDVVFTYSIDGEENVTTITSDANGAKLVLEAKIGATIKVSASLNGYLVSAFDGYSATAKALTTRAFMIVDGTGADAEPISGATFDIRYAVKVNEYKVEQLTTDENGLAMWSGIYDPEYYIYKDGVQMSNVGSGELYNADGTVTYYVKYNLGDYYSIDKGTVAVGYVSAYNSDSVFSEPVSYRTIAPGKNIDAKVGDSIALKAPSIDGFEFVAWVVDGVVVSENADYTLKVDGDCHIDALYSAVHYEEPAEGLSMNVLVIGIVILILGILAVAYGIISKKQ